MSLSPITLSAPQHVTNVIKARSRVRVWVGRVHTVFSWIFNFFHASMKKFNQWATMTISNFSL